MGILMGLCATMAAAAPAPTAAEARALIPPPEVASSLMTEEEAETYAAMKTERLKDDADAAKGFVISFDNDAPKKPKPALRPRRPSKRLSLGNGMELGSDGGSNSSRKENVPPEVMICIVSDPINRREHLLNNQYSSSDVRTP